MPRRNRSHADDEPPPLRLAGAARTEARRGREWHVQPVSPVQALKAYRCPGCGGVVEAGLAHLVVWRADGVLGDRADLEARRHWHSACWTSS